LRSDGICGIKPSLASDLLSTIDVFEDGSCKVNSAINRIKTPSLIMFLKFFEQSFLD